MSNSWLSQYIARMEMILEDYLFDSIITKKEVWCKGGVEASILSPKALPGSTNLLLMRHSAVSYYYDINIDACRAMQHLIYYNGISLKHLRNKVENIPFLYLRINF